MPLSRHHSLHRPTHGPLSANSLQNRTLPAPQLDVFRVFGSKKVVFCSRMMLFVAFGSKNRVICSRTALLGCHL